MENTRKRNTAKRELPLLEAFGAWNASKLSGWTDFFAFQKKASKLNRLEMTKKLPCVPVLIGLMHTRRC